MEKRPEFYDMKSFNEFKKYYWYRDELAKLCKQLGIRHNGTKQDFNHYIEEYFKGNLVKKQKVQVLKKISDEITMDCPLLDCGFSFNTKFREFFAKQTNIANFKFNADMAAAWRKVKQQNNKSFTIRNMLDIYYHKSNYACYDAVSCEWNKFLKDFCADERNIIFHNKIKVASILWKIVRNSSLPKIYTYTLVQNNWHLLEEYKGNK